MSDPDAPKPLGTRCHHPSCQMAGVCSYEPDPDAPKPHALDRIQLKPRTTVKRFASDLKARIERAAVAFDQPGQDERVAGMRYVLGIVDAALSDYDVRDPGNV